MNLALGRSLQGEALRIPERVRREHTHVLGVSGTGKSTFLLRLIQADILSSRGVTLIDQHGTLADEVLSWLFEMGSDGHHFRGQVINLIEPSNRELVVGFNLLEKPAAEDSEPVEQLMTIISEAWGGEDQNEKPGLTNVLYAVLYYLRVEGLTLAEAPTILRRMRDIPPAQFLAKIKNPEINDRFVSLLSLPARDYEAAILSTINRLDKLLSTPVVKRMLGQKGKTFSFAEAFAQRAITIINLSENATGSEHGAAIGDRSIDVLGAFFLNTLKQAATQRPKASRSDTHFLYIDECSRFLGRDSEYFLTGCRKFGLAVTLAHQNISQLKEKSEALLGAVKNVRNFISFALPDPDDCRWAADKTLLGETYFNQAVRGSERPTNVGVKRVFETSHNYSTTKGTTESHGDTWASGTSASQTHTEGEAQGSSISFNAEMGWLGPTNNIYEEGFTAGLNDNYSVSDGSTNGESYSEGGSESFGTSESYSEGVSYNPTYVPLYENRPSRFYSGPDQLQRRADRISRLGRGEAILQLDGAHSQFVAFHLPQEVSSADEAVFAMRNLVGHWMTRRNIATPLADAESAITNRRENFLADMAKPIVLPPDEDDYRQ